MKIKKKLVRQSGKAKPDLKTQSMFKVLREVSWSVGTQKYGGRRKKIKLEWDIR